MTSLKTYTQQFTKILLVVFFLMGGLAYSQSMPKLQKDGKYKAKKHKMADHHQRIENKRKHHKVDFGNHSKAENQTFSKKKNKRKNNYKTTSH